MGILAIVGILLKTIWFFITSKAEWNKERKEQKKEIAKEVNDALEAKDISRVNAAIDRARRL